jgi:hypothetical protein
MKELIQQLSAMNKGADAHTINKAMFYMQSALNRGWPSKLEEPVRAALVTGDWSEVRKIVDAWW